MHVETHLGLHVKWSLSEHCVSNILPTTFLPNHFCACSMISVINKD